MGGRGHIGMGMSVVLQGSAGSRSMSPLKSLGRLCWITSAVRQSPGASNSQVAADDVVKL